MMSAKYERIRVFGVSRGVYPFVFLVVSLRDSIRHRQPACERSECARFLFVSGHGLGFVSGDYLPTL